MDNNTIEKREVLKQHIQKKIKESPSTATTLEKNILAAMERTEKLQREPNLCEDPPEALHIFTL